MKKHGKPVVIVGIVLCIALLSYFTIFSETSIFTSSDNESSESGINYVEAIVQRGEMKVTASGSGNIEPSVTKEIKAYDTAIVDKIYVEEGEFVNEGDLILTFESDTENVNIESAKLDLQLEQNDLQELKEDLNNLKIYAETSGYIGDIDVKVGDELSKGDVLSTITDKTKLEISGYFNTSQIKKIEVGDEAEVVTSDFLQTIPAKIIQIKEDPIASSDGSISYEVIAEIDNPGGISTSNTGTVTVKKEEGTLYSVSQENFTLKTQEEITLKIDGELIGLYIEEGEYVEKGQLIAELENTDLENSIKSKELDVEKAELSLTEKLEDVDDLAVYAPITGTITSIDVTEGERVGSNETIAVVSDLENLQVVIPVDELDINKVQEEQRAVVSVSALSDKTFDAKVTDIALLGDINNGVTTYDVTLTLSEIEGLKPGMTSNGEVIIESKTDALILPIEAIQQRRNQKFVLVKNNDNEPQSTEVSIGLVSNDYVEIIEGVNEGDVVVYPVFSNSTENSQRTMGMMGGIGGINNGPPEGAGDRRRPQ